MKTIGELRTEQGWSRSELARRLDVSHVAVLYWEKGENIPSVPHLRAMAALFGVCSDSIKLPKLNGKDDHAKVS